MIYIVAISFFLPVICFIVYCLLQIAKINKQLKRNTKVYDFRMKVLNESMKEYDCLPSYDEMLDDTSIPVEDFAKRKRMLVRMEEK